MCQADNSAKGEPSSAQAPLQSGLSADAEECRMCGASIRSSELCDECADGNDPFVTCDNVGRDLRR